MEVGGGYGDYYPDPESHHNLHHHNNNNIGSNSVQSSWSSDYPGVSQQQQLSSSGDFDNNNHHGHGAFPAGIAHYHHHPGHGYHSRPPHHYFNFSSAPPPTDSSSSIGSGREVGFSGNSTFLSGRKRPFPHPCGAQEDYIDGGSVVKLYVAGIPRTATEQDIRSLFGEHGNIVEVVILKDKRTGQQLESCFVKYSKLEEADRAIEVLNNQHIFPGVVLPLKVRYADTEKGRLGGIGMQVSKVFVGCLDKQASKRDIEEIFSTYGLVQDVFILYDEMKQSRGRAFVQFSHRDMAVAAIHALNGTYTMKGCDQPLIVRFADPKKPKTGEPRGNSQFGGSAFGPCSQESVVRPAPFICNPMGRHVMSNTSHLATPQQSSQSGSEQPPAVSSTCTALETSTISYAAPASGEPANCLDCDWSEHVCPDGCKYFYNCVTCESRWEKPEEYALYEQQLQKQQQWKNHPCSTHQVPQMQQEFDRGHMPAATSPVLASPCC
ncbi:hypothetical protein LguiB_030379 [Lonicera macranthoides]